MPVPCDECKSFSFWRRYNGCHEPWCVLANARAIRAGQTKFKARKRAKMSPPPPGEQADATTGASGFLALTEAPFVQQQRPLRRLEHHASQAVSRGILEMPSRWRRPPQQQPRQVRRDKQLFRPHKPSNKGMFPRGRLASKMLKFARGRR